MAANRAIGARRQVSGTDIDDSQGRDVKATPEGGLLVDGSPFIIAITKSDATTYDPPLLGIRCGGAGNVKVVSNGSDVTINSVVAGETIPGRITKVYSTDTTATNITGWQRGS